MKKIKTRETRKTIKTLDKAAVATERMKDSYVRSRETAARLSEDGYSSPSEYAGDQMQNAAADGARDATYLAAEQGKKLAVRGRDAIRNRASETAERTEGHFFGSTPKGTDAGYDAQVERGRQYAKQAAQSRAANPQRQPNTPEQSVGRQPAIKISEVFAPDRDVIPAAQGRPTANNRVEIKTKDSQAAIGRDNDTSGPVRASSQAIARRSSVKTPESVTAERELPPMEQGRQLAINRAKIKTKETQLDRRREDTASPVMEQPFEEVELGHSPMEKGRQSAIERTKVKTREIQLARSREVTASPAMDQQFEAGRESSPVGQGRRAAIDRAKAKATEARLAEARESTAPSAMAQSSEVGLESSPAERGRQLAIDRAKAKTKEAQLARNREGTPSVTAKKSSEEHHESSLLEQGRKLEIGRTEGKINEAHPSRSRETAVFQAKKKLPAAAQESSSIDRGRHLAIDRAKAKAKEPQIARKGEVAASSNMEKLSNPPAYRADGYQSLTTTNGISLRQTPVESERVNAARQNAVKKIRHREQTVRRPSRYLRRGVSRTVSGSGRFTQRRIKTAELRPQTMTKAAQLSVVRGRQAAQSAALTAQRSAQAGRAAKVAAATATKAVAKATREMARAIATAARGMFAAITAGGTVAVIVIVVLFLIGLIAGSCFGVAFSSEDSGTGLTMQNAVSQITGDLTNRIEKIKEDYEGEYDKVVLENADTITNWPDVIAIYAVKVTTDTESPEEVATMTQNKVGRLREICWDMNPITAKLVGDEESTVLQITMTPKSYTDMMDEYKFTDDQKKMVKDLIDSGLLDKYKDQSLQGIVDDGDFIAIEGTGGYIWPLQGYTRTSSPFGYRICPFHGRELHGGVDIPAPYGTAVHAAKSGTVALSRYGSSYGNYIVLAHGDGTRTLYAHMSARLVSPGQTVSQGQTIGRVGSTGSSTGNHLHFETWTGSMSSSRVNPMRYF